MVKSNSTSSVWLNQCVGSCDIGSFAENSDWKCQRCNQYCSSCNGSSIAQCQGCVLGSGYYLTGSTCAQNCSFGFFGENSTGTCQQCTTCVIDSPGSLSALLFT